MQTHLGITRDEALQLMKEHLTADNLQKHCLATEAIMRALARRMEEDEDLWGIAGLLHDLDYAETKDHMDRHTLRTAAILEERGVCNEIIEAIKGQRSKGTACLEMVTFTYFVDHAAEHSFNLSALFI